MSQSAIPRRLKRIKARFPISPQNGLEETSKSSSSVHSRTREPATHENVHRMLRILLGHPWDDYDFIRNLGHDILARRKVSYFKLVDIRQCHSSETVARILSGIQHPNIATVYDLYCDGDIIFLVTEHLDISISQLEFQKHELEEWEIATIITEVSTASCMMMT